MAESYKGIQTQYRGKSETNTQTFSPSITATTSTPTPPTAPPISDEVRDELTSLMQELLMKTHELSFEYSTCDCEKIRDCPIASKSRELFKVVKKLHGLMGKITPPEKAKIVT